MVCVRHYHYSEINKALYLYSVHRSCRKVATLTNISKSSVQRFVTKHGLFSKLTPCYKKRMKHRKRTLEKMECIQKLLGDGKFLTLSNTIVDPVQQSSQYECTTNVENVAVQE